MSTERNQASSQPSRTGLPAVDLRGRNATVSMTELRSKLGEVFQLVERGLHVRVEKNGKHVATIVPPNEGNDETTIIHPDGRIDGRIPLTYRRPELLRGAR